MGLLKIIFITKCLILILLKRPLLLSNGLVDKLHQMPIMMPSPSWLILTLELTPTQMYLLGSLLSINSLRLLETHGPLLLPVEPREVKVEKPRKEERREERRKQRKKMMMIWIFSEVTRMMVLPLRLLLPPLPLPHKRRQR